MESRDFSDKGQREKRIAFFYVLLLFISISIICSYILFFWNSSYHFSEEKQHALEQMAKVSSFREMQRKVVGQMEVLDGRLAKVDPSLNASYEKREINYSIGEIRKIHVDNKYDGRFRLFEQVALFYELCLFDKERLWSSKKNIERFNADLERCRSGVENKKLNFMH
ncbi:MAG: type VI secretion system transmembrane protein TssO [Paludibacteraceae bacterium]|nr:type VI secretion system transmembrane protein TssO [Paludibacteraceae bacterium]